MIKKLGILMLVFAVLCNILCSCDTWKAVYRNGIDNFGYGDLDYSLCAEIFIPQGMLTNYKYIDGNYWGYLQEGNPWPHGKTFIYLQYDADTYSSAKQYMLENALCFDPEPSETPDYAEKGARNVVYAENGYVFYYVGIYWFWFGFNDERRTLYFFGLYNSDYPTHITSTGETYAARASALYKKEGIAGFLREYYSEYYDFGI